MFCCGDVEIACLYGQNALRDAAATAQYGRHVDAQDSIAR